MALLVGLTGSMGSGKTLASSFFKAMGAHIIDADELCRELVAPGNPAWEEIVNHFGKGVLCHDQTLDRAHMAKIVFSDPKEKDILEGILHPAVIEEEKRRYETIRKKDPSALTIIDAALLIESGNHLNMDKVIVIRCERETQIRRAMESRKFSREEVMRRLENQMELEKKVQIADYILENDGDREELYKNVQIICKEIGDSASGKDPVSG